MREAAMVKNHSGFLFICIKDWSKVILISNIGYI
jgi:hypothetical protein